MQQLRNIRWLFFIPVVLCSMAVQAQDAAAALVKKVKTKLETVSNYEASGVMKTNVSFIKVPDSEDHGVLQEAGASSASKKENGISIMPKGSVSLNQGTLLAGDNYTTVAAGTG